MKRALLALAAAAVLATACGNSIHSGTIVRKQSTAAHTETVMVPHYGYREVCTYSAATHAENCYPQSFIQYWLPTQQYVPADYQFKIRSADKTGWVSVTRAAYYLDDVGQYWSDGSAQ